MGSIETYVIFTSLLFVLLSGGIIFFSVTFVKRQIKHHKEVDMIRSKAEASLLKATLDTQEKERERIGANLHDDIGPLLSSFKMYFKNELNAAYRNDKEEIQTILEVLDENIEQVRDFSRDLVPNVLKQFGMKSALVELKRRTEKISDISIQLDIQEEITMDEQSRLSVYRIIQEAINNAVRHGDARHIKVMLKWKDRLLLQIEDDGSGFKTDQNNPGLGLRNIEARAKSIGAKLDIKSEPGKGTVVNVTS